MKNNYKYTETNKPPLGVPEFIEGGREVFILLAAVAAIIIHVKVT